MKKILVVFWGFSIVSILYSPTFALNYEGRFSIGGGIGQAYPTLPDNFKNNTDDGLLWSGNIKYGVADDTALVASYANIQLEDKNTGSDLTLQPIILSLRYYAFRHSPINPYLTLGAGISMNERQLPGADQEFNKFAAQGGVGIEFFITPTASIGAEGLYHHFVATADESPLRLLSAAGTVNFYFGTPEETKEAKREAEKAREEAEQARQEQERLRKENEAAISAAAASEETARKAREEAERQAQMAQQAQAQLSETEQHSQELETQAASAQTELDRIKGMMARKEIEPIKFQPGSDVLLVESYPTLDKVSKVMEEYPELTLRIEGHTDSVGDDASNLKLSQRRADAVKNYLVTKANISSKQIDAVGLGESKPIASNDNPEGRSQNRRVEFIILPS